MNPEMDAAGRVGALRELMKARGLSAYLVGSEDAHMSEYVAACDRRRVFLTGFTGSAGVALVTMSNAYLWTDGRYFVQAEAELDASVFTMMKMHEDPSVDEWVAKNLPEGAVVGVDASTMSISAMNRLSKSTTAKGKVSVEAKYGPGENLVDTVWGKVRPGPPASEVFLHGVEYAGEPVADKLAKIRAAMKERGAGCWSSRGWTRLLGC